MKKSNKILLGTVLALIFVIGCGVAGFMKANHPQPHPAKEATNSTKQVSENKHSKRVKVTSDNKQSQGTDTDNSNFSKTPWTTQSALDFLHKVNDASAAGARVVNETDANYIASSDSGDFPGNSIFVLEQNRSGVGDGGVVLTKNGDNTVTLTFGTGAESWPDEKVVVNAKNYKVLSQSEIKNDMKNRQNMWQYFGVKAPKVIQDDESESNDDDSTSDDNSSASNKNSDDNKSDHNDGNSSDDNDSDNNDDNSQSSDTNNDDSDN